MRPTTPPPPAASILVASDNADNADDAAQVQSQLKKEHDNVSVSTQAARSLEDFAKAAPHVLVLAFKSIEAAQRYSLALYRGGISLPRDQHRTILLCEKDAVSDAYDACRMGLFDDYVLFWPLAQDGRRLAMSVWIAVRETAGASPVPGRAELDAHARRIGELDGMLVQRLPEGRAHSAQAADALRQAQRSVEASLEDLARRLDAGESGQAMSPAGRAELSHELKRLNDDRIAPALLGGVQQLKPLAAWAESLEDSVGSKLADLRDFASKVKKTTRALLVVDDDELIHHLVRSALKDQDCEIISAQDGATALAQLRRSRPDLVLLDVGLPDMRGVDLLADLKKNAQSRDIPVVMITGDSRRETIMESVGAGAAGYVVKPFARDTLRLKVKPYLME